MEGMGLIFTPAVVIHLLGPLRMLEPIHILAFLQLITSRNTPNGGFNPPPVTHTSSSPTLPAHAFIHVMCDITVVVKKVTQNPAVLAS